LGFSILVGFTNLMNALFPIAFEFTALFPSLFGYTTAPSVYVVVPQKLCAQGKAGDLIGGG
jgi:hypothetical protein